MKITRIKPLPNFQLEATFDDNTTGVVDLSSLAGRGVFAAWNEPGLFEQAFVTPEGAVAWPGDLDLCADALYLRMTGRAAGSLFPTLHTPLSHA